MSAIDGIDEFAAQLAGILKEKNAAYGDSFARVPTILADMYKDVPPDTLDKLGRIAQDPLAAGEDAYLSRRAADIALAHHLPATTKGVMYLGDEAVEYSMPEGEPKAEAPSEPNGRIKRDMAYAEVTQEPTGWYIVCFEGRDRQFFNDFGVFWAHDIRDATSFLSQEAAELCLRRREGASCE